MTPEPKLSPPFFYAAVSLGATVLADFFSAGDHSAAGDLPSLAARCLDAAPRLHLLYTHTARRRIFAFLISDPLLFFAIADESLGRHAVLLFLHRLRDATAQPARRQIDAAAGDPLPHYCLQDEILPVIRRLALSFSTPSPSEEQKPSPSPLLALPSPPLSSTPPSSDSHLLTGEHKRKVKKEHKKNSRSEEEDGFEISVMNDDGDADHGLGVGGGRKSMQRIWRQHVRMVLVIDVAVCTLLFGIWLSVCRGFQCIGG